MSIKFDANGNIDPSSLEKDLQQALDSDVKYKQTDNMKKRAIKVAGSYDEFKNMVACAHLKKVRWETYQNPLGVFAVVLSTSFVASAHRTSRA